MAANRVSDEVTYVRGEMAEWSDVGSPEPAASGPVLEHLVEDHVPEGSRVLVVGVHDPALVSRVVDRAASVILLLRSRPDALQAVDDYAGMAVEVVCGDAGALHLDKPADVLLALDGLDRAVSAESPLTPWRDRFDHLRNQLVPHARILLSVHNTLGLSELGGAVPHLRDDDAAWRSVTPYDATLPRGPEQLRDLVPGAEVWSLHPRASGPRVAVPAGTTSTGSWNAALCRMYAGGRGGRLDRPTTMDAAVATGRADDFAAGWLLVSETADAEVIAPETPATAAEGRVLEDLLLEASAARDLDAVRKLFGTVAAYLRQADAGQRASLAELLPSEVLLTPEGTALPLRTCLAGDDDGSETGAEAVLVRWVTDFTGRLSTLGWKHPWPEAAGEVEISRLVVAALHLDPDSVPATPAPPALTDQVRPEHVARLELENRTLRAKVTWFEDAVRHRDTQLAAVRHNQQDPRPRLSRKLSEAESELVAIRASRSYLLGQALTSPLRAIRARTRQ